MRALASILAVALGLPGAALAGPAGDTPAPAPFTVVVDPGHGGPDFGGRSVSGAHEKDVVLRTARRIGSELERVGLRVVYTRTSDEFVSLAKRTEIANQARAELLLSIHANAAPDPKAQGFETYFLSLEASDEDARRVAAVENDVFRQASATPDRADVVGDILSDLIRTQHLRDSSAIAAAIQRRAAALPGSSRGVKQAPFAVLGGVNMPAVLLEVGFLTNRDEEARLRSVDHQRAIARVVAEAVREFAASHGPPSASGGGR